MCITKNVSYKKKVKYLKSLDNWDLTKLLTRLPHESLVERVEPHRNMIIDILDKKIMKETDSFKYMIFLKKLTLQGMRGDTAKMFSNERPRIGGWFG